MNIFATAALVSLFAGLVREVPGELLDEKVITLNIIELELEFVKYVFK